MDQSSTIAILASLAAAAGLERLSRQDEFYRIADPAPLGPGVRGVRLSTKTRESESGVSASVKWRRCSSAFRRSDSLGEATQSDGTIAEARIIPPTSQNQGMIEDDLRVLAAQLADLSDDEATHRCEHLVRNYDPCISCSTHFLKLAR